MTASQAMETLKEYTLKVKLVAECKQPLGYILYVFHNLENKSIDNEYITLVRFPNWEQAPFQLNDEGFVHFKIVEAGKDEWYDNKNEMFRYYQYTNCIFLQFILSKPKVETQIYTID